MPKVTEEYRQEMQKKILFAVESACMEKPAYLITMRDVIRAVGLSPGAVYSYYSDINALWVDYLNAGFCAGSFELIPAELWNSVARRDDESADGYLERCCAFLKRIGENMPLQRVKIYYELEIKRASDPDFAKMRREGASVVGLYKQMVADMAKAVAEKSNADEETIYVFIKACFEGLAKNIIEKRCYGMNGSDVDFNSQIDLINTLLRRM